MWLKLRGGGGIGVHGRTRTCDLRIRNPLLFRLSYVDFVLNLLVFLAFANPGNRLLLLVLLLLSYPSGLFCRFITAACRASSTIAAASACMFGRTWL
jgi:hypothetical protein